MDAMEKIVEALRSANKKCKARKTCQECKQYGNGLDCVYLLMADELISCGVTVQEWVDVKDRLPEESGMYIVTANDGHAQRVSFVQWQKKNRIWNLTGARSYWRVTHWMPMPQPPKGNKL